MESPGPSTKEMLLDAILETGGEKDLHTVAPKNVELSPDSGSKSQFGGVPACITQESRPPAFKHGPTDIMVSLNNECPRWTPGSVIRWAAWRAGFDSQDDANYAAYQLEIAAQTWNAAEVGVTFEWVPLAKDATFVLCHGGDKGGVLASAFFPNANDLNYVFVYTTAFGPSWKGNMWRVFLHELGHILGLRHEFAMEKGPRYEGDEFRADELGTRNPLSVMNYRTTPPEMQPSDISSTRLFYELKILQGANTPFVGSTPVIDYTPR